MNQNWPTALINGIDHFVAKKLAGAIWGKDINVIGIGEGVDLTGLSGEIEVGGSWRESEIRWNYVFDFWGNRELWQEAGRRGARLTIVEVGEKEESLVLPELAGVNWRRIRALGVYGPGMNREGGDKIGEWLAGVLKQAVLNQNLVLFGGEREVRLLAVDDLVEVVLRASMLSGTEGEDYVITGEKVLMKELAEILVDEAKMTRHKVMVTGDDEEILEDRGGEADRERLRWVPERAFREGIKETLQYFFLAMDEEKRGRKGGVNDKKEEEKPIEIPRWAEDKTEEAEEEIVEEEAEEIGEMGEEEEGQIELKNLAQAETEEILREEEVTTKTETGKRKTRWRWWLVMIVVGIIVGYFPTRWIRKGMMVVRAVERMEDLIRRENYGEVKEWIEASRKELDGIENEMDDLGVNRWEIWRNYQKGLKTLSKGLEAGEKGVAVLEESRLLGGAIWEGEKINWEKEIEKMREELGELGLDLGELRARLVTERSWLLGRSRSWWQKKEQDLEEMVRMIEESGKFLEVVDDFIGTDGEIKKYLVLFQNENELRPGGGFIGAYGLLIWQGGWLKSLEIRDVYEADGQLRGHVEPPEEIKKHLGEAGWKMRDANWKASFPEAAKDVGWFLEKEIGVKTDGVIGINLAVAREILGVVGEIYVPEFGEKINKDNLYEQAEFWAETRFFPGSIQKASFLGAAGRQLFEAIRGAGVEKQWQLGRGILNMLEGNEIQITVGDKRVEKVLADLGWNGAVYEGECAGGRCYADYLYIVEANVGVNKANYFLRRNVEEMVEIKEKAIERVVRINYENTAKNSNWPGGDYKNYLRVYLPGDVVVDSVSWWDQNGTKRVVKTEEIKTTMSGERKELGFLVTVGVGERKVVEVKYASRIDLNRDNKFSYLNYIQRQSGYGDTGLVGLVAYPSGWNPLQVQPMATITGEKLLFNMKFDRDIKMGVEIGR